MGIKNRINVQEYVWDFAVDGGAQGTFDLSAKDGANLIPVGAVVTEVTAIVLTEVDSAADGSTIIYGPTADADGYSGTTPLAEAGLGAGTIYNGGSIAAPLLWDDTNDHQIYHLVDAANDQDFVVTLAGEDATAGKIVFVVEYYFPSVEA